MPSFDAVLEPNLIEVRNAIEQTSREIGTRFDFKGSSARVELVDKTITAWADSDFQLGQVRDVLHAKLPSATSTCASSTRPSRRPSVATSSSS